MMEASRRAFQTQESPWRRELCLLYLEVAFMDGILFLLMLLAFCPWIQCPLACKFHMSEEINGA